MKRMILVDGNSLMYRAYYGMANTGTLTCNSKGLYTNAIYAFARMMNHLINSEYDAILVAFDAGKKTLRHDWMTDYKAGRAPMPDEFRMQIAYIKEYLDIMRIKRYEQSLYEADDIIGTMAKKASDAGYHVDIYSSDKDLLQLIGPNTTVHLTKKGMTDLEDYTPDTFYEKYNIKHTQFIDLKAMMGDKSDNLPGIPGIGEKKAVKYLQTYGTLDNMSMFDSPYRLFWERDQIDENGELIFQAHQQVEGVSWDIQYYIKDGNTYVLLSEEDEAYDLYHKYMPMINNGGGLTPSTLYLENLDCFAVVRAKISNDVVWE